MVWTVALTAGEVAALVEVEVVADSAARALRLASTGAGGGGSLGGELAEGAS